MINVVIKYTKTFQRNNKRQTTNFTVDMSKQQKPAIQTQQQMKLDGHNKFEIIMIHQCQQLIFVQCVLVCAAA
jgi:hypothetical protein